jgi:uncharacterized protein
MEQTYLNVARQGKNRLKDYIAGTILIFSVTMMIGFFAIFVMATLTPYPASISIFQKGGAELFIYGNNFRYLIINALCNAGVVLGIFIAFQRVHKRKFLTLISPNESISWYRAIEGFIIGFGLWIITFPIRYFIDPTRYMLTFNPSEWIPIALFSLAILPIISFSISLLLAYLLQGLGLFIRKPIILLIIFAVIPCLWMRSIESLIIWVLSPTFIVWVVLKDNRLELATGLMAAKQLISMIFISSPSSAVKLPTIIKILDTNTPLISIASLLLTNILFYYICFGISKNRPKSSFD